MRVGVDLDGVLYNFGDSVKRYLEATGRGDVWKSGATPKPFWNFYEDWGWTLDEFKTLCNEGADAGYIFCGPTRPNARTSIEWIKSLGHKVVIITDRAFGTTPEVSQKNTRDWLAHHRIPYDELHFSADKTVVATDMFVEDKVENFVALEAAGTDTYLITRSWNEHFETDKRINDIIDFAFKVRNASRVKV